MRIRNIAAVALFAAALMSATQAGAVSVVGAERVRITSAVPSYLQIAEVIVTEYGTSQNVAAAANGGSATAASALNSDSVPAHTIDGSTAGLYGFGQIYHSGSPEAYEYLDIVLGHAASLAGLTIWSRDGCCENRHFYNVEIFGAGGASLFTGQLDGRPAATDGARFASLAFDAPPGSGDPTGGVPEPGTWALMILGFGLAGSAMRARGRRLAEV